MLRAGRGADEQLNTNKNTFYSGSASAYSNMVDGTNVAWASVSVYDGTGISIASNYISQ